MVVLGGGAVSYERGTPVQVADLNLDGRLELLVGTYGGQVAICLFIFYLFIFYLFICLFIFFVSRFDYLFIFFVSRFDLICLFSICVLSF